MVRHFLDLYQPHPIEWTSMHLVADVADAAPSESRPPALGLFLTEPLRGAADFAVLPWASPWLAHAPRGDGHGVLVLPGLMASDLSTRVLRRFLRRLGYRVEGWALGRNRGPTAAIVDGMPRLLDRMAVSTGGPVSIVGWSLGGIFARELAREHPDAVRQVITLGSPFALTDSGQSRADRAYRRNADRHSGPGRAVFRERARRPIPVPSTAIYSRADGIVSWQACVEPASDRHENVAVRCSHLGFGVDAATYWVVADRLAQQRGQWQPFKPPAAMRLLYPSAR
jgi:pimeloyl-ACP methyl ester carboxylesterase